LDAPGDNGGGGAVRECVVVRALEMSEYSFFVYDLTAAYVPAQGWVVVGTEQIAGAAS